MQLSEKLQLWCVLTCFNGVSLPFPGFQKGNRETVVGHGGPAASPGKTRGVPYQQLVYMGKSHFKDIPVVPHKAVAEVSKIGNL